MPLLKRLMKKALKLTLLVIRSFLISTIIVATFAKIPIPSTLGWMDLGWQYRKPVTIENTGSTATNEDVLLTVDTLSLVNEGKLQADCDDLRFTDSDENTSLDYWIESGCNTSETKIWTQIPSLTEGGKTIYMYYGNPTAISTSLSWTGDVYMYADTTCPSGWTRASDLDGKYLYGSSTYGTTGGSNSHAHSDTTATSSSISTTNIAGSTSAGTNGTTTVHTHTTLKSTVNNNASVQPPYKDAILCYSNSFLLSQGLVSMFDTDTPTGYTRFSALDGVFPKANTTYGTTGGSATHTHTNTTAFTTGAAIGTQVTIVAPLSATGGTITTSEGDTIHTFTSSGTFTVTNTGNVEALVIAGGGGGGYFGGGGAGGYLYQTDFTLTSGNKTVTIGGGGTGAWLGNSGSNSVFDTLTAYGGGGGGNPSVSGITGGSGGGGVIAGNGSGTSGQGYAGGTGVWVGPSGPYGGGGGGGASQVGFTTANNNGGNGGAGIANSISGSSVYYAGGGGGGGSGQLGGLGGSGGNGGGGNGARSEVSHGTAGTNGLGGGGGGGGYFSGNTVGYAGGSGIVIIRYSTPASLSGTIATNTHTHTSASATTSTDSNLPPYLDMVFAKANTDQYVTENNVIITSALPPLGWNQFTALDSKFTRGALTYGGTGGTTAHTHSVDITTGAPSATLSAYGAGANFADSTHTHSATITSDAVSNLPSYTTVIYAQRDISETTILGTEEVQNTPPSVPTSLLTEDSTNPTLVSDSTPEFSAIFTDVDGDHTGNYYQIQVNTASDFTGTSMWDSTKTALSPIVANGDRSGNLSYAGDPLSEGSTYYWRIKFWDSNTYQNESDWSETAQFTMNYAPTALSANISGDEDIYAGKEITLETIYSDSNGIANLDKLYLQIKNPSGTDIEYYITSTASNQTGEYPTSVSGAPYVSGITYDTIVGSPTTNDITVTWHLTPNWTWTRGTDLQYGVKVLDHGGSESTYAYVVTEYKYENRLTFTETITVNDSESNSIVQGDWTPSNQILTFSGVKVVYSGTTDIYPLDSDFDVNIINEESTEWEDLTSSGENISIDITTAAVTNIDDTYTLSIINIPTGGTDVSNSTFHIKTDNTQPTISSLTSDTHPNQSTWYTATSANFSWTILDGESGIENTWYIWDRNVDTDLVTTLSDGTQISSDTMTIDSIPEGSSYLHLATKDNCGNTAFDTYVINIDTGNPIFNSVTSTTHSNQANWYSSNSATISWTTSDTGSGVLDVWKLLDQNESQTTEQVLALGEESSANDSFTTPELTDGIWYLHLVVQDNSGKTAYARYTFKIDQNSLDIVSITGLYNGVLQNVDSGPIISWTDPNSISDDTFYITNDGTTPTSTNYTYYTSLPTYDLPAQKQGETTIKVSALNGAGTYSDARSFVIKYDSIAPTNVGNFVITPTQTTASLTWRNPTVSDFTKVIIMRSNTHAPISVTDGTKLYEGTDSTFSDTNLTVSTRYYYTIFALDRIENRSSGTLSQTTTLAAATTPVVPVTPDEPEPVIPTPQPESKTIKLQDLSEDQKVNITTEDKAINVTTNGDIHTYANQTLNIEIPASTITDNTTDLKNVIITVNNQTYNMTYDSENDTYNATIDAPSVKGVYTTTIQTISNENTSDLSITMSLLVDPYGYIFTKSGDNEVRILNAKVTLYTKRNGTETIWQSEDGTTNPQYTNQQGEYQFFVAPGEYKLVVEAKGYIPTETEWFPVESNIVEKNIEMTKTPYLWFGIIAGVEIIAGIGIFAFLKRKKKTKKRNV